MRDTLSYLAALLALACACHDAGGGATYPVLVRAVDELGKPLARVEVTVAGVKLGATDAKGQQLGQVPGSAGQRLGLSATCPAGYDGPRERPTVLLQRAQNEQGEAKPLEVSLTCDAHDHIALVAIRTGQPNLPIVLRGQEVGRTSSTGTAHVMLREPTGSTFDLKLDTASRPELKPASPTQTFTVAQEPGFTVWDRPFEHEKKRRRAKKPGAPPSLPPVHVPEPERDRPDL